MGGREWLHGRELVYHHYAKSVYLLSKFHKSLLLLYNVLSKIAQKSYKSVNIYQVASQMIMGQCCFYRRWKRLRTIKVFCLTHF